MTELRKAAEKLLEALDDGWVQRDDLVAITLRQALAQPEPWDTSDMAYRPNGLSVEQSIAQPEQEPVDIHCPSCLHSFSIVPVAKREWVSLTDEEIDEAIESCKTTDTYKYFRAIEAKLKEKNNG